MLVLSRKKSEEIVIGEGDDAVVVTVVELQGGKVRLGITAPKNVRVLRKELLPPSDQAGASSKPKPKPKAPPSPRRRPRL